MVRTPPWIWSDNTVEATQLIAFALHCPEVTGHVPNLYSKKTTLCSSESQGKPSKMYCCYLLPPLPSLFFLELIPDLGTA